LHNVLRIQPFFEVVRQLLAHLLHQSFGTAIDDVFETGAGEMANARVLLFLVITIGHADGIVMCVGFEDDLLILRQRLIDQRGQVIQTAERGQRSRFAIGKELSHVLLAGHCDMIAA